MKTLILLRHGKSNWDADYAGDHERPLAGRGRKAAKAMGQWLARIGPWPDRILCSTAKRTTQTCRRFVNAGGTEVPITYNRALYGASVETVIAIVRSMDDDCSVVMVVGHEPTSSSTTDWCTGGTIGHFPTAAVAAISFDVDRWSEITESEGTLVRFQIPRKL